MSTFVRHDLTENAEDRRELRMRALELVNAARAATGFLPLDEWLSGCPSHLQRCPIGRALHARVTEHIIEFDSQEKASAVAEAWGTKQWSPCEVNMPDALSLFVRAFDCGLYPDLNVFKTPAADTAATENPAPDDESSAGPLDPRGSKS